jgi:LysM repeat protein
MRSFAYPKLALTQLRSLNPGSFHAAQMRIYFSEMVLFLGNGIMTPDPMLFKRIRHLSLALIVSGALNIGVLSLLLYWVLRERPPTPYYELKPASSEQQQIPLADQRGCAEMIAQLSQLSFSQLVSCLSHVQLIENGYAERDLALACLMAFHHFDIQRALPKNAQPQQKRFLAWKPKGQEVAIPLFVYPDLTQQQFDALIQFAKKERWPLTAEGLFLLLKNQKANNSFDDHLIETFVLTREFWTVELLFNRSEQRASRLEILTVLLEGDWSLLKQFVDQQRQLHDSSDARRQKFLLDYVKAGSSSAAMLLLKTDWDFAAKKLDDQQVLAILQLMPLNLPDGIIFAKEMLTSPRSTKVWRQASQWLYMQAGEQMPIKWTHHAALVRFVPEKASTELISKLPAAPAPIATPLPLVRAKTTRATPIQPDASPKSMSIVAQASPPKPSQVTKKLSSASSTKKEGSSASAKTLIYIVKEGDSLWKISQRFGVKVDEIKKLNGLKSDILRVGMILKLPKSSEASSSTKTKNSG